MSAYKKKMKELNLSLIKNTRELNGNDIQNLIEIIEEHEKRITELEGK